MQLCYLDESGDANGRESPVFVVGGIVVDAGAVEPLTREFIEIKNDASPKKNLRHEHDYLKQNLDEIKGSSLRKIYREDSHPKSDRASVLERTVGILELYEAEIVGYIRRAESSNDPGEAAYHRAVRHICKRFNHRLAEADDIGIVIADNRDPARNSRLAHSIYVEKFRGNDRLPQIVESLTFGQSENHAGLQIADIVCSALLAPIAAKEKNITQRFSARVKSLRQDVQLI
jgi:hypothetical protein